jgi:hypothetical protein
VRASAVTAPSTAANSDLARPRNVAFGSWAVVPTFQREVSPAPENRYALRCFEVVPDSDARSRLRCAPTVTPLRFPHRIKSLFSVASGAPAFLSCSTRRVAASDVVRVHRMPPDRRDFELCCPVLRRRYFGETRPVATTIEAGLIDGRAKSKIEVSA